MSSLPDVQESSDTHIHLPINKVGITNIKMPFSIAQKIGGLQHTVGNFSLYVSLLPDKKGTHMSRFIIELQKHLNMVLNKDQLILLGKRICEKLESDNCYIDIDFSYFIKKKSPITKCDGLLDYNCQFNLEYNKYFNVVVNVPVTSLCPCSKQISKYGAHNQRSIVTIKTCQDITNDNIVWIEDLINIAEQSASCELYSVLKREDEKYVTERAYKNAKFCEDIVRDATNKLNTTYDNLISYEVSSSNMESIHNHIAYATITG